MGRDVKRVPLDFNWPIEEIWSGYLMPHRLRENPCPDCENGYSPRAQRLFDLWYGNAPFDPESTGSTPLRYDTPTVWEFARRSIDTSPEYYGTGYYATRREAQRLADLWNGQWRHHLAQQDVDALVAADRLWEFTRTFIPGQGWQKIDPPVHPTAKEVNDWSLCCSGHDDFNAYIVIKARCELVGVDVLCGTCGGRGRVERYDGQRAEVDAWKRTPPPTGTGWQLWETVSEGSPISPVFATAEELAHWLTTPAACRGDMKQPMTIEQARGFVSVGWAPSGVENAGGFHNGAEYIGTTEAAQSPTDLGAAT